MDIKLAKGLSGGIANWWKIMFSLTCQSTKTLPKFYQQVVFWMKDIYLYQVG